MKKPRQKVIPVLGGATQITVNIAGKGKPLLYLHAAAGYYWDDFLDTLADYYTVYVPHFPGTAPGRPNDIDKIDNLWDAVIAYEDLLDGLGLKKLYVHLLFSPKLFGANLVTFSVISVQARQ